MAIVVVGGQSKNVGKSGVVAGLIAAMPEMRWTALKISLEGEAAGVAVFEEHDKAAATDSGRFLAAGAARSLWARTRDLAEAMPQIRRELEGAGNVVIESNSILQFLEPAVYLSVLDPAVEDFKDSAWKFLERADAVLVPEAALEGPGWKGIAPKLAAATVVLPMRPPVYATSEVVEFVRERLAGLSARADSQMVPRAREQTTAKAKTEYRDSSLRSE